MLKILDDICKPTKGSKYSAAIDLYAREDMVIGAGETVKVALGVCIDSDKLKPKHFFKQYKDYCPELIDSMIEIDDKRYYDFIKSHYLQIEPRSSLRAKGLIAGTGIIDLDYKDEIMIILHNPIIEIVKTYVINDFYYYTKGVGKINTVPNENMNTGGYKISKGDKIAQILLKEHKTYLMGVDTEEERVGGLGSTGDR